MGLDLTDKTAVMNAALAEPVIVIFGSKTAANDYRLTCYGIRGRVRKLSRRSNPPSDPAWNTSPWDRLSFRVTRIKQAWPLTISVPTEQDLGIVVRRWLLVVCFQDHTCEGRTQT